MKNWNFLIILFIYTIHTIYCTNALAEEKTNSDKMLFSSEKTENTNKDFMSFNLACKGYETNIFLITKDKNSENPNKYIFNKFNFEFDSEHITFTKKINGKVIIKRFKMEDLQKINKIPLSRKAESKDIEAKCFELVLNSIPSKSEQENTLEVITITLCAEDLVAKKKSITEILKSKQCQLNSSFKRNEKLLIDQSKINQLLKNKESTEKDKVKNLNYDNTEGSNCCPKTSAENKAKDMELKKTLKEIKSTIVNSEIQKQKNIRIMKNELSKQIEATNNILKKDELIKKIIQKREESKQKIDQTLRENKRKAEEVKLLRNVSSILEHFQKKNIQKIKNAYDNIIKNEKNKKILQNMNMLNLIKNITHITAKSKPKADYHICVLKDKDLDYKNLKNAFEKYFNKVCDQISNKNKTINLSECRKKSSFCKTCCGSFYKVSENNKKFAICNIQCENSIKEKAFEISAKRIIKDFRDNLIISNRSKNSTNNLIANKTGKSNFNKNAVFDLNKIINEYKQTVKNSHKIKSFIKRITTYQKTLLKENLKIKRAEKNKTELIKGFYKGSNLTKIDKNNVEEFLKAANEINKVKRDEKSVLIKNLLNEYKQKQRSKMKSQNKITSIKNKQENVEKKKEYQKEKDIIKNLISEYNNDKKKKKNCRNSTDIKNPDIEPCPEKLNLTKLLNLSKKQKVSFEKESKKENENKRERNIKKTKYKNKNTENRIRKNKKDQIKNTDKKFKIYKNKKEKSKKIITKILKERKDFMKKIKKDIKKQFSIEKLLGLLKIIKKIKKRKVKSNKEKTLKVLKEFLPHLFKKVNKTKASKEKLEKGN